MPFILPCIINYKRKSKLIAIFSKDIPEKVVNEASKERIIFLEMKDLETEEEKK